MEDTPRATRRSFFSRAVVRGGNRCLKAGGLFIAVMTLLVMSGMIEENLLPCLSGRLTGIRVSFWREGLSPLHIRGFEVRNVREDEAGLPPLLRIEALRIDWAKAGDLVRGKWVSAIHATGVQVHVHTARTASSHPEEKTPARAKTLSYKRLAALLPKEMSFTHLNLHVDTAEWSASMEGIDGRLKMESLDSFTGYIGSDNVNAGWRRVADAAETPFPGGEMSVTLQRSGESLTLNAHIQLPEFLTLEASARAILNASPALAAQVERLETQGPLFGQLASAFSPVPISFDSLAIGPLSVEIRTADREIVPGPFVLDARCVNLAAGLPEASWYAGDVQLNAAGDITKADWNLTLNRGQEISGSTQIDAGGIRLKAAAKNWTGNALMALWPERLDAFREYAPQINGMSASLTALASGEGIQFEANLNPQLPAIPSLPTSIQGDYRFAGTGTISAKMEMGEGTLECRGSLAESNAFSGTVTARKCSLPLLAALALPTEGAIKISGTLDGSVNIKSDPKGNYRFETALSSNALGYDLWSIPESLGPASLEISGSMDKDLSSVKVSAANLVLGEGTSLAVSAFKGALNTGKMAASFSGTADLAALGGMLGYPDLWGTAALTGRLSTPGWSQAVIDSVLALDSLGYDNYSLPYGQTLEITCPATLSLDGPAVRLGPILATLGDDTRLEGGVFDITAEGISGTGTTTFSTGFAPLVAKNYLSAAEGHLSLTLENIGISREGIAGTLACSMKPSNLTLPDSLAQVSGLSLDTTVRLGPTPAGEGRIALDEMVTAGIHVKASQGDIRIENGIARADDVSLDLLGGSVTASIEWALFEEGMPLTLRSSVEHIDLAVFTNEFKPESILLTGLVKGKAACTLTPNKLAMLDIDLESTENFSMNRDMVEQLLMNQYMTDITGGRQISRMVQSVLGKESQCFFERAQLKLGLENERIAGVATLESKALNLTVDIKADPLALLEALRVRQDQQSGQ